ncbi:MAG: T9SS type A sorting domain-containing protein [Saprospiraceae bacterium]|nr:T9SS type A sorting domain-containing protein [Saprospiraceae bacterium]
MTEITARGGIRFKWNNNAETPGIFVSEGLYSVTVTNEGGCTASVSKSIQKVPDPKPVISGISSLCEGEVTQLTVTGGQSFVWNTGATSTSITVGPGTYSVTATNEFNCIATVSQIISSKPKPDARTEGNTNICSGQTTVITASGGVSYNWSTGAQSPSIQVSPSTNTSYRVTVTGTNGCTDIETIFIKVNSDPIVPTSEIRFSAVNRNQMTLNWKNGDGVNRIVVARANSPVVSNPKNGFNYIANQAFGFGSMLGSSEFVVYNGTGSSVTVTNLIENNIYHFRIFEYGCTIKYLTSFASGNPASQIAKCLAPTLQVTTITFSFVSTQQFTITWSNGNGSRRVVKINTLNQFTPPANGTDPTANTVYSGSGEQVVYNGSGNSVTVTGLKPNTVYWVRVYEANCEGIYSLYNTTVATQNPNSQQTVLVPPYIQSFTASTVMPLPGGGTQREIFYHNTNVYGVNSPITVAADGSANTVFTLKASFITGMGLRIVNKQGKIVTNGDLAFDPVRYGRLGVKQVLSHNTLEMTYTHPQLVDDAVLPLRIQLLYYDGLLGLTIPLNFVAASPLPVEISNFDAYHDKSNHHNEIFWTTQSEKNNDHFVLERRFEEELFKPIGIVEGAGNSSSPINYNFHDKDIYKNGTYTYRLQQVDFDGGNFYSWPVSVRLSRDNIIKTGLYPNPSSGLINLFVEAHEGAKINIDIFNVMGQLVKNDLLPEIMSEKNITSQIEAGSLKQGLYTVIFTIDGERYNHKLIVIE